MKNIKQNIKKNLPGLFTKTKKALITLDTRSNKKIFTDKYENKKWGLENTVSGPGSNLSSTVKLRSELPALIEKYGIKSILDAGCGDYNWMKHCNIKSVKYSGIDVVEDLIKSNIKKYKSPGTDFIILDASKIIPLQADIIICRDVMVHLPFGKIKRILNNFIKSGSVYLLATSFEDISENEDILSGGWRGLNLQAPPFSFPEPVHKIYEYEKSDPHYTDKIMGLWKLSGLKIK